MVDESTKATAEASAVFRISSASFQPPARGLSVLESLIPGGMRWGFMITAGGANGGRTGRRGPPRPNPAILRKPQPWAWDFEI